MSLSWILKKFVNCVYNKSAMKTCHFIWTLVLFMYGCDFATQTFMPEVCETKNVESVAVHKATPASISKAGKFELVENAQTLSDCLNACCDKLECNTFLLFGNLCYLIECNSDDSCAPVARVGKKFEQTYTVPVRPVKFIPGEDDSLLIVSEPTTSPSIVTKPPFKPIWCIVGLGLECPDNEYCKSKNNRARQGHCECEKDFQRDNETRTCIFQPDNQVLEVTTEKSKPELDAVYKNDDQISAFSKDNTTSTVRPFHRFVVSAGEDKVIQLPENSVTLSAFAVTEGNEGENLKYEWTLLMRPEGDNSGTMIDKFSPNLKLTGLKAGVYMFKVGVTTTMSEDSGEAFVNVTVLPAQRNNKPPVAIIQPDHQVVKVPNTDIILDGSRSTDDDKILSYHWEEVMAPIGHHQSEIKDISILQLKNLIPGFYRFKLTVTDSDGATNSTFSNVTVDKETDYPPKAVAGADVMVQLPASEVILNGNASTDDKGIKSWEWTRSPGSNLAVDMQGTRSPILRLSNLQPGDYTFILKVMDTADQTAVDEVQVVVKEENNYPPIADAGSNQEVLLQDPITLDGSKSKDDSGIVKYEWNQISGPHKSLIKEPNSAKTDVKIWKIGDFQFQLMVYDSKGSFSSAVVNVTVKQGENKPPQAHAGGDKEFQLPNNLIILNGSLSTDDVGIVSYQWIRDPTSLAAGEVLGDSDKSPVLQLTNLSPGRYIFHLKVTDAQGSYSEDSASFIVKSNRHDNDSIELYLNADISSFKLQHKQSLTDHLNLLLHSGTERIIIQDVSADKTTKRVVVTFYVEKQVDKTKVQVVSGPEVVSKLKKKLKTDAGILDFSVLSLNTLVCQNNCSGHGRCDQSSHQCLCEAFWMQDFFKFHFEDLESNCDWSILYVIVIVFLLVIALAGFIWSIICLCKRFHVQPRRWHRYTLLEDQKDKESFAMLHRGEKFNNGSIVVSESDTFSEEETIFEKRKKLNGVKTGVLKNPNGLLKTAYRKKT